MIAGRERLNVFPFHRVNLNSGNDCIAVWDTTLWRGVAARERATVLPFHRLAASAFKQVPTGASSYPLSVRRPDFLAERADEDEQLGTHSKPWDRSEVLHGVAAREAHEGGCAVGHRR
jgi:hypothetical protein